MHQHVTRAGLLDAAFLAAAATTLVGAATHRRRLQAVAKPVVMPILAVRAHAGRRSLLALGAAAATVGDIAMIDPDDDRRFTVGASSFGVMQVCWSILLWRNGSRVRTVHAVPRALGWASAVAVATRFAPTVAPVSAAYGATLAAMSTLGADGDRRALIGSALFTASDALILARRTASDRDVRTALEVVVLATYLGAQYALTQSLSGAARQEKSVGSSDPAAADSRSSSVRLRAMPPA